jgi:hypothetical protein
VTSVLGRLGGRRLAALVVLAASVVTVGPALGAPQAPLQVGHVVQLPDLWVKIKAPRLSAGEPKLASYDVNPVNASDLVVTNGERIGVSHDGGRTWTEPELPVATALPSAELAEGLKTVSSPISQVRFSRGYQRGGTSIWALGQTFIARPDGPTSQPRILVSVDGGTTFADRSDSFPEGFGQPVSALPLSETFALLIFHRVVPTSSYEIYLADGAGTSWTLLYGGLDSVSDLDLDFAGHLLVWGGGGLYRAPWMTSNDLPDLKVYPSTTSTMTHVDGVGAVRTVTVSKHGLTVYPAGESYRLTSGDGGTSFRKSELQEPVTSASQGPMDGLVALSGLTTNVLVEPPSDPYFRKIPPTDFSPHDHNVSDVRFVQAIGGGPSFRTLTFTLYAYGAQSNSLFRRVIPADFYAPPAPAVKVHRRTPTLRVPSLLPADEVVTLRPGQRRTVDYRLALPPNPTPLDVYFMTDSTGSMSSAISSVQEGMQQIVDTLAASGINAYFGVADFRDYPEEAGATDVGSDNYPYHRLRKIGMPGADLADALANLSTGGGTADGDDSALEAIYQAVTGAGRVDPFLVRGRLIPAGQGAEWRKEALKVVVIASDDEMRHPGGANPTYPGPSLAAVSDALVAHDVHLVGIEVKTSSATARADMERLAEDSNTVAPAAGIDCNGDGEVDNEHDVAGGDPIVCPFSPSTGDSIAPIITGLLEGVRDYAAVDLSIGGDPQVVRPRARTHFANVNVKAVNRFSLPVEFACDKAHAGVTSDVTIRARSRGATLVETRATVRCLAPPVPPAERRAPALPALVAAVIAPPPVPPAPNPNPRLPNPNPQVNANAGAATNEEDQAQLATAESDQGEDLEAGDEVAFSARRTDRVPLPDLAWVGTVMLLSTAAFGTHLARRHAAWGQLRTQESR